MDELVNIPGAVPMPPEPLVVDEPTARRMLGDVCAKTLYLWRKSGALRFVKLGTRIMYRPEDLAAFVAGRVRKGNGAEGGP